MNTAEMETTLSILRADIARLTKRDEDVSHLVSKRDRLKAKIMKSNLIEFYGSRKAKKAAVQQRVERNYIPFTTFTKEEFEKMYPSDPRVDEGMQERLRSANVDAQRYTNYLVTNAMEHMASGDPLRRPTTWERVKTFFGWGV